MDRFCVNSNAQKDGAHEVHNKSTGCNFLPELNNQIDLGLHNDCHGAVAKAKSVYTTANGCSHCCEACNTG